MLRPSPNHGTQRLPNDDDDDHTPFRIPVSHAKYPAGIILDSRFHSGLMFSSTQTLVFLRLLNTCTISAKLYIVRCAAGISEPFAVEFDLHQGYVFIPFLFVITMDTLTENMRKEIHWQLLMFADDVVLCVREKDVVAFELEQWRSSLEKRGMKVSRAKTE